MAGRYAVLSGSHRAWPAQTNRQEDNRKNRTYAVPNNSVNWPTARKKGPKEAIDRGCCSLQIFAGCHGPERKVCPNCGANLARSNSNCCHGCGGGEVCKWANCSKFLPESGYCRHHLAATREAEEEERKKRENAKRRQADEGKQREEEEHKRKVLGSFLANVHLAIAADVNVFFSFYCIRTATYESARLQCMFLVGIEPPT